MNNLGITLNGVRYLWKDGKLFRLPYEKDGRFYGFCELVLQNRKGVKGYIVQGRFFILSQIPKWVEPIQVFKYEMCE